MIGYFPNFWFEQFRYGNGLPLAGGKLYSYVTETNIPKALYYDKNLQNQTPNPIILDANGNAPQFYLATGIYTFVITDAAGNIIATRDNIQGSIGANDLPAIISDDFVNTSGDTMTGTLYTPKVSATQLETIQLSASDFFITSAYDVNENDLATSANKGRIFYDSGIDTLRVTHQIASTAPTQSHRFLISGTQLVADLGQTIYLYRPCFSNEMTALGYTMTDTSGNKVVATNSQGKLIETSITNTELGYLSGTSANIQSQFNTKQQSFIISQNQIAIGGTNTISGSGKLVFDGSSLSMGVSSVINNPKIVLTQNPGQAGGAEITLNAAGGLNENNSAKLNLHGNRLITLTNTTTKYQRYNSSTSAYESVWAVENSLNSNKDVTFYGEISAPSLSATRITVGNIDNTEFNYLNNARSNIQAQIDAKTDISAVEILVYNDYGVIVPPASATNPERSTFANNTNSALKIPANTLTSGTRYRIDQLFQIPSTTASCSYQVSVGPYLSGTDLAAAPNYVDCIPVGNASIYGIGKMSIELEFLGSGTSTSAYVTAMVSLGQSTANKEVTVNVGIIPVNATIDRWIDVRHNYMFPGERRTFRSRVFKLTA